MKLAKIDHFFERELKSEIQNILVFKNTNNTYTLFGKYVISANSNGFYKVISTDNHPEFTSIRNATVWCTLHNAKKYKEANIIKSLDLKFSSIAFDIVVHKALLNKHKDTDFEVVYLLKLQDDLYKRKSIIKELETYVKLSKEIQLRNFTKKENYRVR